jgi:hypothetical protein
MKSVGILGTKGLIPGIAFLSTSEAMRRVGNNCGNLVFQYAVSNLIDEPTTIIGLDLPYDVHAVRDRCRVLVIPSANFLREGFDLTPFVSFIDKTELPLIFVGLGAQADDFQKNQFDFHPSILKLIGLIQERCVGLSVRGEFTEKVLKSYGVNTAIITGCPSNFINNSSTFITDMQRKLQQPLESFIAHSDEAWPKSPLKRRVEKRLVRWVAKNPAIIIQQSVPRVMDYLRQNNFSSPQADNSQLETSLRNALMPDADIAKFRKFIKTRVRSYFCVDQWLEDSSKYDFSIGLRLHGNMVAWQSGTPSLWIYHDSRTRELVETMELPRISINDFLGKCKSIEDCHELYSFNPVEYAKRRKELFSSLNKCMNGISLREISSPT